MISSELEDKFFAKIKMENGHWVWTAKYPTFSYTKDKKLYHTSAKIFAYRIFHRKEPATYLSTKCGVENCVHPEHGGKYYKQVQFSERDNEIRNRWALHLKHKTTMEKLGLEFDLTRQRVEQIINRSESES